jgi:hypothetical protein
MRQMKLMPGALNEPTLWGTGCGLHLLDSVLLIAIFASGEIFMMCHACLISAYVLCTLVCRLAE